jgi:hypothetical protein
MKQVRIANAVAEQVAANRSGIGYGAAFAEHRSRLTRAISERAPPSGSGRLCLLGAGNANDLDLEALAAVFGEIHLVDIDPESVGRACSRVTAALRGRLVVHAPLDVSGIFDRLERWADTPPPPAALAEIVRAAVERVIAHLPGPFEVVVSCCLLTQLQLVLLQVVGDRNPQFENLRAAMSRIHVRTLAGLIRDGGVALLVTDLTSSDTFPLAELAPDADLRALMDNLIHAGNVIHAAHPGLLSAEIRRDPELKQSFATRSPVGPWLWHNGPNCTFLVYGLEITSLQPRQP